MKSVASVTATTIVQVLTAFSALTIPSLAPLVTHGLELGASGVGSFISVLYAAAACSTVIAGSLAQRIGAVRVCQLAVLACAAGLLCSSAGTRAYVFIGAIALGLGYGPVTPASSQLLAASTSPANRRFIFSLKQTGVPAGTALAGLLIPAASLVIGWKPTLWSVAGFCVVVSLCLQPLRGLLDPPHGSPPTSRAPVLLSALTKVVRHSNLRLLATVAFVLGGAQMCACAFVVSYFFAGLGYSTLNAGLMLTVANVAGVVFRLVWGAAADRGANPRLLLAVLSLLTAAGNACMASEQLMAHRIAAIAACFVLGASAIGWNGVFLAEVAETVPLSDVSTATAGCLFFSFAGVVTFPALFGAVQHLTGGYRAGWLGMGLAAAALGAVLMLSGRRGNPVPSGVPLRTSE